MKPTVGMVKVNRPNFNLTSGAILTAQGGSPSLRSRNRKPARPVGAVEGTGSPKIIH